MNTRAEIVQAIQDYQAGKIAGKVGLKESEGRRRPRPAPTHSPEGRAEVGDTASRSISRPPAQGGGVDTPGRTHPRTPKGYRFPPNSSNLRDNFWRVF